MTKTITLMQELQELQELRGLQGLQGLQGLKKHVKCSARNI